MATPYIKPTELTNRSHQDVNGRQYQGADADDVAFADEAAVRSSRTAYKTLAALLLAGAVLRGYLVWSFGNAAPVISDAIDYNNLAIGLVETGGYVDVAGHATSLRPPLYPLVVSGLYEVFGTRSFWAVSAVQAIVSLATVILSYFLGAEAYSKRVGIVVAAAMCFYPSLLAFNQFLLSEVVFTFFVTAGALLSIRVLKTGAYPAAMLLGLCLGLGALTRSVLWLFAPLLCGGLALFSHTSVGRRLAAAAIALALFAATIAPWAWRNTNVQETLTFIDVMGGRNVMMGNYEYTPLDRSWATIESQTGDRAWHRVLASHTENYELLTQGQIDKAAMRYGVHYFFSHPVQSLARCVVKFFNFWQLEREIVAGLRQGLFGDFPAAVTIVAALLVCGTYAAVIFASLFGVFVVPPSDRVCHALLLAWVAFPCAIHTIAFAHSRYHLPFMPIVLVYSAAALVYRDHVVDRRRSVPFLLAFGGCILLLASWIREFVVLDLKWFV